MPHANILSLCLAFGLCSITSAGDLSYIGPNGNSLDIWTSSDGKLDCTLQTKKRDFTAALTGGAIKRGALMEFRGNDDEAVEIGKLTLEKLPGQSGDVKITVMVQGETLTPDPSGSYHSLSDAEQLKLVRARHTMADAKLNYVYTRLMIQLAKAKKIKLRERQLGWIEYRDYMAKYQDQLMTRGDSEDLKELQKSADYWEVMADLTESQSRFLEIYAGGNPQHRVDGSWTDGKGGWLETRINAKSTGLDFNLSVVRGPTFHLGDIKGFAPFVEGGKNKALFIDADKESFIEGKACTIEFLFDGEKITVKSKNDRMYLGMRAYFSADYYRKGDLD
ncbi:MAG: DUF1311 domain-containing protein [Verrucomicrobiota bacterium]